MLLDPYRISSNFRPQKTAANCNIDLFFESFHDFYQKIRAGMNPDLPHQICDPYGFFILCQDIKNYENILINEDIEGNTCKKCFKEGDSTLKTRPYYGMFTFKQILDLLFRGYYFNYDLAINIYNMQHDALNIFKQIMNGQGYVMNRLKPNKKKVGQLMNYACDSQINLNEKEFINTPFLHRLCDGKSWPCIVSESYNSAKVVEADTSGFGKGLFIINDNNKIIDCLKINDLWLADTPLENRLTFCSNCREYEALPYMKAFSWRSTLEAGKILKCNSTNGILVRSCYENYFESTWFEWSKNSLIYAYYINGELRISKSGRAEPDFYLLEGDGSVGAINPVEERVVERIWLDDFDIKEFQKILELKE